MSQVPVEEALTQGYEPPRNVQFSVFLDNRVGKLLELLKIFEGKESRIVGLSIIDSADYAVVRMVTSRSDLSRRLLERHKQPFSETEILVVELGSDQTLAKLCTALLSAELNIHYAYPLMVRPRGAAAIALHTDDQTLAGHLLLRKLFMLLGENDLGDNASRGSPGPSSN